MQWGVGGGLESCHTGISRALRYERLRPEMRMQLSVNETPKSEDQSWEEKNHSKA